MNHQQYKSYTRHHFELFKRMAQNENIGFINAFNIASQMITSYSSELGYTDEVLMDVLDSKYTVVIIGGTPFAVYAQCFLIDSLNSIMFELNDNFKSHPNSLLAPLNIDNNMRQTILKPVQIILKNNLTCIQLPPTDDSHIIYVNTFTNIASYIIDADECDDYLNNSNIYQPFNL